MLTEGDKEMLKDAVHAAIDEVFRRSGTRFSVMRLKQCAIENRFAPRELLDDEEAVTVIAETLQDICAHQELHGREPRLRQVDPVGNVNQWRFE